MTHLRWEIQRIESQLDHAPDTRATLLRAERRGLILALDIVTQHARTRRRAPDCRGVTGGYHPTSRAAGRVEGAVSMRTDEMAVVLPGCGVPPFRVASPTAYKPR